jgi:hypothetical protein
MIYRVNIDFISLVEYPFKFKCKVRRGIYTGVCKSFWAESVMKYTITFGIIH